PCRPRRERPGRTQAPSALVLVLHGMRGATHRVEHPLTLARVHPLHPLDALDAELRGQRRREVEAAVEDDRAVIDHLGQDLWATTVGEVELGAAPEFGMRDADGGTLEPDPTRGRPPECGFPRAG